MKNLRFTLLAVFCLIGQLTWAQNTTNYGNSSGTGGSNSSYFGYRTGTSSTGASNTFMGASSGYNNTTGAYNTFMGQASGYINTTGSNNTYIGHWSGNRNTTGNNNAALGYRTARFNTTGHSNALVGYMSGYTNTTGYSNVAMGFQSAYSNTTGYRNAFVGQQSGYKNTTGRYNAYLGEATGYTNTTGFGNTLLGARAGYKNAAGSRNVFIGYFAGYNETGSNKLYIDNSSTTIPLIYGDFATNGVGINTNKLSDGSTNYTLSVNGRVRASEVKVYTGWADYVFEKGYKLRPLNEVEAYIEKNGHLPDVPSAKQVEKNGIFIGEMNATLLRKIEELTLYMISMKKEVEHLKNENKALKAKIQK
ncbi:hypothetical protein [Microscilla marina]|uniref:Uncharacterized protein n=1 Tax=Microscilla marina ATCC 23134 TaxID=313606 RepID=A1ZUX1_MICM2|nr:hypothetical protein [Microscilla marina]EAY25875.1 conserved hypothetical protein [Microscilla marina ATCC 23134]